MVRIYLNATYGTEWKSLHRCQNVISCTPKFGPCWRPNKYSHKQEEIAFKIKLLNSHFDFFAKVIDCKKVSASSDLQSEKRKHWANNEKLGAGFQYFKFFLKNYVAVKTNSISISHDITICNCGSLETDIFARVSTVSQRWKNIATADFNDEMCSNLRLWKKTSRY